MTFDRELATARHLARQAGDLALEYRRHGLQAEDKADDSPVTNADKDAEKLLTAGLLAAFPDDGILGEEGADRAGTSGRRWIVDPIDGTRDYLRGNRFWCNLIGLEAGGVIEVGVATFPALQEQYYAIRGRGAWREFHDQTVRLHASTIGVPERAVACVTQFNNISKRPHSDRILPFLERFWAVRSLGGALDSMLVASGQAELWFEPTAKPWDLAALSLIAKEAGCRYYDYEGNDTIYGGNAVICAPAMEPEVRAFLGLA